MSNNEKRKGALGRGIDALFTPYEESPHENEIVEEIALDEIRPNPYQPRKTFDEDALNELAESIRQSGVFQPVIVRQSMIRGYELIAGERRVRASRIAGKDTIPAIVRQIDDTEMIEIAVVENLQREDLTPMEEAEAYQMLMDKLNLTQAQVAERIGKSRPYIANHLRMLTLPESVKGMVNEKKLSMGQARTLLSLEDKSLIEDLAEEVVREGLTVRQLERRVQEINESQKPSEKPVEPAKPAKPVYVQELENRISSHFGTSAKVVQQGKDGRGKIEIQFMSDDDLTRIMDILDIQL